MKGVIDVFNFCQFITLNTWNWDYEGGNQTIDKDDSDSLISAQALPSSTKSVLPSLHIVNSKRNWNIYVGCRNHIHFEVGCGCGCGCGYGYDCGCVCVHLYVVLVVFIFIFMFTFVVLCCVQCLIIVENFRFLVLRVAVVVASVASSLTIEEWRRTLIFTSVHENSRIAITHTTETIFDRQSAYSDQIKSTKYQ